jgi:hypothetical protein
MRVSPCCRRERDSVSQAPAPNEEIGTFIGARLVWREYASAGKLTKGKAPLPDKSHRHTPPKTSQRLRRPGTVARTGPATIAIASKCAIFKMSAGASRPGRARQIHWEIRGEPEPAHKREHFMQRRGCGKWLDCHDLGRVFERAGPPPHMGSPNGLRRRPKEGPRPARGSKLMRFG